MHPNDNAFWNALQSSELLTLTQRKWIKKHHFSGNDTAETPTPQLAINKGKTLHTADDPLPKLVLEKKWLSPFQVQLLLKQANQEVPSGQSSRPLVYGPFVIYDQLQPPKAVSPYQFHCRLTSEHSDGQFDQARFVARFLPYSDSSIWQRVQGRIKNQPTAHLVAPIGCIQLSDYRAILELDFSKSLRSLSEYLISENGPATDSLGKAETLSIVAGLATALQSLHQEKSTAGVITPAEVFVTATHQGYLRTVCDAELESSAFARQILDVKIPKDETQTDQPIVVKTDSEKPKPATSDNAWQQQFCQPKHSGTKWNWSTADFLAPEIFAGQKASAASDLYSLGCLLYFLTTGQVPFPGKTWQEKRQARLQKPKLPESSSKSIQRLLDLLLEPNPSSRQVSSQKIAESLFQLLNSQPEPVTAIMDSARITSALQWLDLQDGRVFPEPSEETPAVSQTSAINIQTESLPVVTSAVTTAAVLDIKAPTTEKKRRWEVEQKSNPWMGIASIAAFLAVAAVITWQLFFSSSDAPVTVDKPDQDNSNQVVPIEDEEQFEPSMGWNQTVVQDDGKLLWESPTLGFPNELDSLPPNPYIVCFINKQFWTAAPTPQLLNAISGIKDADFAKALKTMIDDWQLADFDQTLVAQYQIENQPHYLVRVRSAKPASLALKGWKVVGQIENVTTLDLLPQANPEPNVDPANPETETETETTLEDDGSVEPPAAAVSKTRVVLVRKADSGTQVALVQVQNLDQDKKQSLAMLPLDRLQIEMFDPEYADDSWDESINASELIICDPNLAVLTLPESGKTQLTLPMSTAINCTDQDRHFQIVTNPVSIWNEAGRNSLGPNRQWFADLIKTQIPTQTRAMYFSTHFEPDQVYLEAKFVVDRSTSASSFLDGIYSKLDASAGQVERTILSVPRLEYWDTGLLQFDDMLKQFSGSIRLGLHNKIPTMNSWLPKPAVSNLIAETDLYFTASTFSSQSIAASAAQATAPADLEQLLATPRTVKIPEQDLVNALADMQSEIKSAYPSLPFDFQFELDGNSLLLDGITQNQKITDFQQIDQPLADILAALVLKANPDKAVTSPKDPKCKLTWLPHPDKPGVVLVTTRGNVEKNGWNLPPQVSVE